MLMSFSFEQTLLSSSYVLACTVVQLLLECCEGIDPGSSFLVIL